MCRTATFEMRDATSPPQQGQAVYIGLGSPENRQFGGQIIQVTQRQSRHVEMPVFAVECEDSHRLLDRRLVWARFQSRQAGEIIKFLVSSFTSGFTANHVQASMGSIDEIEFTAEQVTKAIGRVMQRVGGRWYLDPWKDVHAFTGEEAGVSPAAGLFSTGRHEAWAHSRDLSQLRTRVYVRGWEAPILGDASGGVVEAGHLGVGISTGIANFVGAQTVSVGRAFYQLTSTLATSSTGAGALIFATETVEDLSAGAPVALFGIAQDTAAQAAVAAIEGGDGVHEYYVTDGRLTYDGALERAQGELLFGSSIEHSGSYTTRDPNASAGRLLTINVGSPTFISSVSARIQRVSLSNFEQSKRPWNTNHKHLFPQRKVQYSSGAVRDVYQILGDFERTS